MSRYRITRPDDRSGTHEQRDVNLDEDTGQPGQRRRFVRVGAGTGLIGVVLLVTGTAFHPVPPNSNDAATAFAAYAEVSRAAWLNAHLLALAGITGMVLAMVLLSLGLATTGREQLWARLTGVNGATAIAVTAVLQAVDGVALRAVIDLWFQASAADRPALHAAALAVRQVEIGLDAVFSLALALTTLTFGLTLWRRGRARRVLAVIALETSATSAAAGVLFGLQGFSPTAMNAGMTSGALGIILTLAAAGWAWVWSRRPEVTVPRTAR